MKPRYRTQDGADLIEVNIRGIQQIFDSRDPAPFRDRDLDDDFVEYVVASAKEIPSSSKKIKILIHLSGSSDASDVTPFKEAITDFFSYQIELQSGDLKRFLKRAQSYLLLGAVFLFACLGIAQSLAGLDQTSEFFYFLREGIIIFGWVGLWRPMELILFDWYPLLEKIRLYERIQKAEIEFRFSN